MRNPLLYYNPTTNSTVVSYFDGKQVIYTHTVDDIPQKPYRIASPTEFKMIIENGDYMADENTFCTWNGTDFEPIKRDKYWKTG